MDDNNLNLGGIVRELREDRAQRAKALRCWKAAARHLGLSSLATAVKLSLCLVAVVVVLGLFLYMRDMYLYYRNEMRIQQLENRIRELAERAAARNALLDHIKRNIERIEEQQRAISEMRPVQRRRAMSAPHEHQD